MDQLQSKDTTFDGVNGASEEQEYDLEEVLNAEKATNNHQHLHRPTPPPFAFLIDVDNTGVESFPEIVKKAETLGIPTLRRAYGNQEALLGQKWKDLCLQYAVQPMVHLGISGVKNATDIALVVDAMDLFHTQEIRHFCLVTGDQDFTALVLRLRSYGCQVYGIGKPSKALAKVCTAFFPLEELLASISGAPKAPTKVVTPAKKR
ncbi:MAG TPA: NYN domain-containing protein [Ktedonobacteraceae bacterium]|nr:NYN domain-containing protein [Ktedonobacteraceae bacterium]